jgi:hypothetical protein
MMQDRDREVRAQSSCCSIVFAVSSLLFCVFAAAKTIETQSSKDKAARRLTIAALCLNRLCCSIQVRAQSSSLRPRAAAAAAPEKRQHPLSFLRAAVIAWHSPWLRRTLMTARASGQARIRSVSCQTGRLQVLQSLCESPFAYVFAGCLSASALITGHNVWK